MPPADAPPATGVRLTLLPPPGAHDVVRPRRRRLQPAADVAGVQRPAVRLDRRDDVPLEPLIEPLGRRLVGHRQQDRQRQSGPGPTRRSPTPVPSASGSAPPATTASPAAHRRPSPQPRPCAARPGSSSDRQRTTVSRRARSRPAAPSFEAGAWSIRVARRRGSEAVAEQRVCGRGRNPTPNSSACSDGVEDAALRVPLRNAECRHRLGHGGVSVRHGVLGQP